MIALIILLALVLLVLFYTGRGKKCACGCGCIEGKCTCKRCDCAFCKGKWTVYGTEWCGWTNKQLDYMKKNGKVYEFVDCEQKQCSGIKSFPTLVSPEGEKINGYREV